MFQRTYSIVNGEGLDRVLAQIGAEVADPARALLLALDDSWDEAWLRSLLSRVRNAVPGLRTAGISSHERHWRAADRDVHTTLSLICFEEASFELLAADLSAVDERAAACAARLRIREMQDAKAVMLFSTGVEADVQTYMDRLNEGFPTLPIFGSTAGIRDIDGEVPESFVICDGSVYPKGLVAVVFRGESLRVEANEEFGWTPIGKRMTVTRMKDRNTVLEIDGKPASEIYTHYLGLTREQITADNACEFPIFRMARGRFAARISLSADVDGSVRFGAPLFTGDQVQFSYGNPDDILSYTEANAARLTPFQPQALLVISCVNRSIFLGKEQEREIEAFRRIQPQMVQIHGNSELLEDAQGGGELNSALVYAAMREGEPNCAAADVQPTAETPIAGPSVRVPLARRLLTFLSVTTRELIDLEMNLSDEVQRQTEKIRRQQRALNAFNREIVMTLSNAIDAKDSYTNGHSRRVAEYAQEIARRYGYSAVEQEDVYMIGLLHDVGKIGVPDEIINKPGKLTDEEFAMIKRHPAIGADILSGLTEYPDIASGAHWHHERWDGRGYPDGLKGPEIPEIAQIISVADAYDAMTSTRSYRPVMEQARVRGEIERGRGTQFSPVFTDIMLQMIDDDPEYRMKGNVARVE